MILKSNKKVDKLIIAAISIAWALFQLSLPRLIILDSTKVRAVHLAFAITLVFLTHRFRAKQNRRTDFSDAISRIPFMDYILAVLACLSVLYFVFDWTGITTRAGLPIRRDIIISVILIVLLLEAARRAIGPVLAIIAIVFTLYAFLGPYMPLVIAFGGVSLRRYLGQIALSTE
ncbi:MAG: TRAP transporter permease, partial [Planctomycetota bacterium]